MNWDDGLRTINLKKRVACKRAVQTALQRILNDPSVMPNVDCGDLVVSVSRVEFGRTVREIYIDVTGHRRRPACNTVEDPHDRYMREAQERGEDTYIDFIDMFVFPNLTAIIGRALQDRLGLLYCPDVRRLCDLSDAHR